ncbi:glycosyltransferase family 39 protein [Nodosilinea sp. P-1105]|uniref:ArnT family glycosyltransferase n=1 Tax=Nodosilinea sp. P-1105 TaxID=2546229 RepID=UPI00146A449D|nr:glycosyltransferase family 39 protein [Nodosilinea sp. P-1105]NMF85739.1 4-amino-4-deoxy-L-arabinose transferase [Nodosilinea sp. P-1105]
MKFSWRRSRWSSGLVILILGGLIYRTLVAIWLFPGFDEAYYYLYSRHLHWSYFDHPPIVAWTTGLGWWLTGVISPLTIRLGALGLYCLSLGLLYLTATYLYAAAVGVMTVALVTLIPLFTIGFGILTAPDTGLILFWSATLLTAAWEFFPQGRDGGSNAPYHPTWRIALLGLWVGLACLSKYHGFVLGLSLVGFCLACAPYRSALRSPWTVVALGLFVITLFPLWYWNSQHDWISFRFQLGMRFDGPQESSPFSLEQMVGYWLISIAYLFPLFGFPLWWVTARKSLRLGHLRLLTTVHPDTELTKGELAKDALILWLSLPIMLLFTLLGGQQQILPAWPAPGYWGVAILLGQQAVIWQRQRPRIIRCWLWGSGWFLVALSVVAMLHLQLGFLQQPSRYAPFGGLVPVDQDGSTELLDTGQMRQLIAADPALMTALGEVDFIFTNEYYLGGYLGMAIHPLYDLPITAFSQDPRGFAFWFDQRPWLGQDAFYITLERFVDDPAIIAQYTPLFDAIEPLTTLSLRRGGVVTETLYVYRANGFQQPYEYPYGP